MSLAAQDDHNGAAVWRWIAASNTLPGPVH